MPNAAVRSSKSAAAKKAKTKLNLDDLQVGEVTEAPGAFQTGISADHPLAKAFQKSYDEEVAVRVDTSTPELVEKVVRRLAVSRKLSARVRRDTSSVTIQVRDPKPRARKVETASDEEARSEE